MAEAAGTNLQAPDLTNVELLNKALFEQLSLTDVNDEELQALLQFCEDFREIIEREIVSREDAIVDDDVTEPQKP